jgi:hypothetical protein
VQDVRRSVIAASRVSGDDVDLSADTLARHNRSRLDSASVATKTGQRKRGVEDGE